MELLIGFVGLVLIMIFLVQIGKAKELASMIRNNENEQYEQNRVQGALGLVFVTVFLLACIISFIYYIPYSFGWAGNIASSELGKKQDAIFNTTLFVTSIVFFITHILLFYYSWKYRGREGHKAIYWAHDEKLELIWMLVPSVVLTFMIVSGLKVWNEVMEDIPANTPVAEYIEIEATGRQFAWSIRYPGRDNMIGTKNYTLINDANNIVGQDWNDAKNLDDFHPTKIVLPKGKKVRVRITSRDVLHDFYLPQFRVKMDAVPGMPTKFIFTPTETTAEAKMRLSKLPEWNVPDKKDPSLKRYEAFVFELACAELCGKGHYSMRMEVEIVTPEEYVQWLDEQEKNSYYLLNVRGKDFDPYKDKIVPLEEIMAEKDKVNKFVADLDAKIIDLDEKVTEVFTNAAIELAALQDTARTTPDIEIAKENAIKAAAVFNAAMNIKSVDQPLDSVITDNPVDTTLSKEVSSVISSDSGQLSKNE